MTEQLDIPWLEWARSHKDAFGERAGRLFEEAIEFAEIGFDQPAWYRSERQSVRPDEAKSQAEELTRKRHLVWRVALAEALSTVLPADFDRRAFLRGLAQTLRVPPGLFLQDEQAHLSVQGNWIDTNVMPIINRWEQELDVRLLDKEADWPKAWNIAIVLETVGRVLENVGEHPSQLIRWVIVGFDSRPRRVREGRALIPTAKVAIQRFSPTEYGGSSAESTVDRSTTEFRVGMRVAPASTWRQQGLKLELILSRWAADLFQYDKFESCSSDNRYYRYKLDANRLSEHGNAEARVSTGLTVWDLYLSLAVEGLQQLRSGYVAPKSFDMNTNVPHELPHQLADEVPPATWSMFSQLVVAGASSAQREQASGQTLKLKTLFAPPPRRTDDAIDAMVATSWMGLLAPAGNEETGSLGSICPNMRELDPDDHVNWMEVVLAVQKSGQWGVVRPELIDDEEAAGRIHLHCPELPGLDGLTVKEISQALPKARWGVRLSGHGAFFCATLYLD